jgi:hypothetical protein
VCTSIPDDEFRPLLHSMLPCKVIYSKDTVFVLNLSTQTRVAAIDQKMNALDEELQLRSGSKSSHFVKISDVMSGMVRTFGKNAHEEDEYCKEIFSGKVGKAVHAGVKVWTVVAGFCEEAEPSDEEEPSLIAAIIKELDELNEPNPLYLLAPGENAEVLFLQKEVAEANALTELAKRKLHEYESNGVEAGGGEVFDLKKEAIRLHERMKTIEDERDAALKDADTNNWKLIEIQRSYANLSRFLREEQQKNRQLLLSNIKCKDGNGVIQLEFIASYCFNQPNSPQLVISQTQVQRLEVEVLEVRGELAEVQAKYDAYSAGDPMVKELKEKNLKMEAEIEKIRYDWMKSELRQSKLKEVVYTLKTELEKYGK